MLKEFNIDEWKKNELEESIRTKEKKLKAMKNEALTTSAFVAFILFVISACMLDSKSWIPIIVCAVSVIYLFVFLKINGLLAKLPRW